MPDLHGPDTLFSARPADDGTDTVVIRVDTKTALQLATAWDYAHQTSEQNMLDHPLWWWDVAALRRAAADAVAQLAASQTPVPCTPTEKARAHLRLVHLVEEKTS